MAVELRRLTEHTQQGKSSTIYVAEFNPQNHLPDVEVHRHDCFQLMLFQNAEVTHTIDFNTHKSSSKAISLIFPNQLHATEWQKGAQGKIIMFDETVFCSQILANELKEYNIDLQTRINFIDFSDKEEQYQEIHHLFESIKELYNSELNDLRRMQMKFLIKIIILKLIDVAPNASIANVNDKDMQDYTRFKELVDLHYKSQRKIAFYTNELGITSKKLSAICQAFSATTPLDIIHEKLTLEIKKMIIYEGVSMKEMAYEFDFSSQSALNKYIHSKFGLTPTELKAVLLDKAMGR